MARPLWIIVLPGAFYHVSARRSEHKTVFESIRDRQKAGQGPARHKTACSRNNVPLNIRSG
jgi:hypothetical protein